MHQVLVFGANSDGSVTAFKSTTIQKEVISVTTDGSGNASKASTSIFGKIVKLHYDRDTVDGSTTAVTTITDTSEQVDSINVNAAANQVVYPVVGRSGASAGDNKWVERMVSGTLTITVTGGATSKHFNVNVYYVGM